MNEAQTRYVETMPTSKQGIFRKAYSGKRKSSAVKAKCLDCAVFKAEEIRNCTVQTCPLWPYRPYQEKEDVELEEVENETEETDEAQFDEGQLWDEE